MKPIPMFKRLILLIITVNFIFMTSLSSEMKKLYKLYKKGLYPAVVQISNTMIEEDKDIFVAYYYLAKTLSTEAYEDKDNQRANSNIKKLRVLEDTLSEDIKKRCFKRGRFNTDSIVNLHERINQKGIMIAISSDSKSCLWEPYDYYLKNYDNKYTSELSRKADSLRHIRYTVTGTKKVYKEYYYKFTNSLFCEKARKKYNQLFINEIDTCNSDQTNKVYYEIKKDKLIYDTTITYCITQYNSKLILDFEELKSIIKRYEFFQQLSNKITHPETKINLNNLAIEVTTKEFSTLKNSVSQRFYIDSLLSFPFIDIEDGTWWNDIIDTYNKTLLNERENTPPGEITNFLNTHEGDTLITRETRTQLIVILNKAYSDSINKTFEIEAILSLFESWSDNNYRNKILLANEWNYFVKGRFENILISKTSEEIEELLDKHSLDSLITDEIEDIYTNKVFAEFDLKILDKKTDYLDRLHKLLKNNKFYFNKILQYTIIPELKIRLNNSYKSVIANESTHTAKRYKIIDWRNNKYPDSIMVKEHIKNYHEHWSNEIELMKYYVSRAKSFCEWRDDPLTKINDSIYFSELNEFLTELNQHSNNWDLNEYYSILSVIKRSKLINIKEPDFQELTNILNDKRDNKWQKNIEAYMVDLEELKKELLNMLNDTEFPIDKDKHADYIFQYYQKRYNILTQPNTYEAYKNALIESRRNIINKVADLHGAEAEDEIYSILTQCQCVEGYQLFIKNHCNANDKLNYIEKYVNQAYDNLVALHTPNKTLDEFEYVFRSLPDYPDRGDVLKNIFKFYVDDNRYHIFLEIYSNYDGKYFIFREKYLDYMNYKENIPTPNIDTISRAGKQESIEQQEIDSSPQNNKQIEKEKTTDLHKNLQQVEDVTSNTETELNDNQKTITVNPKEITVSSSAAEDEVPFESENHSAEEWYIMGNKHFKATDYTQAINCYKKAIELQPNNSNLYYNLGICYIRINEKENAVRFFEQSLSINPENINAYQMKLFIKK